MHTLLAGCCIVSLSLLPILPLGEPNSTTITPSIKTNVRIQGSIQPISNNSPIEIPSKTQIFLAFYGPNAQRIGWLFNGLATISLVHVSEICINRKGQRLSFIRLLMFLCSIVAFISSLLLQPIDDHLTASDGPYGGGTDWYFEFNSRFFFPIRLNESPFITSGILGEWRALKSVRDIFALSAWVLLIFLKFICTEKRGDIEKGR